MPSGISFEENSGKGLHTGNLGLHTPLIHHKGGIPLSIIISLIKKVKAIPVTASVVWWSEFLATDPEARVRFPALPKKSSGSRTVSTQPREYN
jgi:hypothetical protein